MTQFPRNHLAFETQLRTVLDMLPIASAASRQIRARRNPPLVARADNFLDLCDRVVAALRNCRDLEPVSDDGMRAHHGLSAAMSHSERPERHRADFDFHLCAFKCICPMAPTPRTGSPIPPPRLIMSRGRGVAPIISTRLSCDADAGVFLAIETELRELIDRNLPPDSARRVAAFAERFFPPEPADNPPPLPAHPR